VFLNNCYTLPGTDILLRTFLIIGVLIYSTRSINAWELDIDDRKPYWLCDSTLLLSIKCLLNLINEQSGGSGGRNLAVVRKTFSATLKLPEDLAHRTGATHASGRTKTSSWSLNRTRAVMPSCKPLSGRKRVASSSTKICRTTWWRGGKNLRRSWEKRGANVFYILRRAKLA